MVSVKVVNREGAETALEVDEGTTLMEAIRDAGLDDVIGQCGGCCSCATCHVYVDEPWLEKTGAASDEEGALLDGTGVRTAGSRLGCQVSLTSEFSGIKVTLAPEF